MTFSPASPDGIPALIAEYPLAWVISRDFDATLLPLLVECDAGGEPTALLGHYPLHNPQVAMFKADRGALILFTGPQGYVSPTIVTAPGWGPTWNYAALRIVADIEFVPAETDTALRLLIDHLETGSGWTGDAMGERYDMLSRYVVAFRATIRSVEATFKLGQDERQATFDDIVERHGNHILADWMKRHRAALCSGNS